MALNRQQKQKIIEDLEEKVEKQKSIVFLDIARLTVKDLSQLRKLLKEKDCQLKVAKKTLMKIAFKEKGIDFEPKKLEGEIAFTFCYKDEILPFKICHEFSGTVENLKILGGIIEREVFNREKAIFLGTLPAREELLAKLIGSISTPIYNFVNVLQGNIKGLIYVLSRLEVEQRG